MVSIKVHRTVDSNIYHMSKKGHLLALVCSKILLKLKNTYSSYTHFTMAQIYNAHKTFYFETNTV